MSLLLSESGWYPEFSRVDEAATRNDTKTELVEGTHHPLMLGNTHPLAAWLSLSLSLLSPNTTSTPTMEKHLGLSHRSENN